MHIAWILWGGGLISHPMGDAQMERLALEGIAWALLSHEDPPCSPRDWCNFAPAHLARFIRASGWVPEIRAAFAAAGVPGAVGGADCGGEEAAGGPRGGGSGGLSGWGLPSQVETCGSVWLRLWRRGGSRRSSAAG